MEMQIRPGTPRDADRLEALYNRVNEHLAHTVNYPGWKKGVYPTREDAEKGIADGCLYVAISRGAMIGSMILRHEQEAAYRRAKWQEDLRDEELLVVHTLLVSPDCRHQGVAEAMLNCAAALASEQKVKALRLDVYENNLPAIHLYKKCGFRYVDTVSMGLEARGLNWFQLYEKPLERGMV